MLYVLFFASGIAGLVYEVCWVRQFGNVFGNTVHSAALVTAVFMGGLGVGSRAAGGWADRRARSPGGVRALYRAYGKAELGIALFGVVLAWALPRLGDVSASLSSYTRGPDGWYELALGARVARYVAAALLVAPPALLMGATLTLLVRAVLARDVAQAGFRIGALYGANTAGAALGAYLTDALLVPRAGIFGTQVVAATVNVLVAAAAILVARRIDEGAPVPADAEGASAREEADADPRARRVLRGGAAALALTGFSTLGMEVVWFRFLSATIGALREVFSLVLAIILVGFWLGASLAAFLHRRYGRALEIFVVSQTLGAVSALGLMATFTAYPLTKAGAVKAIVTVVAAPSLLMGLSFPLVNAHVQDEVRAVGRRAGTMYLANTVGSVAGSLVAGFVLSPWVGSQPSFAVFAAAAALAPLALVAVSPAAEREPPPSARPLRMVALLGVTLSVVTVAAWSALPARHLYRRFLQALPPDDAILDIREGSNELVAVVEAEDGRVLFTNGHPMSGTALHGQRYMRAFAHVPLLMTERPERALVVCFGVGSTLHATSLHESLTRIDIADLSRNVLSHARFFEDNHRGVLRDPRVAVFVEDGRQHLRQQPPETYDLVTLEPPPISFAGVSSLYSRELYELAKTRLKPTGMMTQWLPVYDLPPDAGLSLVRAFVDAFPASALLSGWGGELILIGTRRPELVLDLDAVEAALRERRAVAADLERVRVGSLTELVGMFVADADALRAATAGSPPVTDDRPIMEYTFGRPPEAPRALFGHTAGVRRFCPKCFRGESLDPRVSGLAEHLALLDQVYATERFRKNVPVVGMRRGDAAKVVARSPYLSAFLPAPERTIDPRTQDARAHFTRGLTLARTGSLAEAAREYEAGLALDPNDHDARYNLAVVYASSGREDDAVTEAKRVLAARPSDARARAVLCELRGLECPDAGAAPAP